MVSIIVIMVDDRTGCEIVYKNGCMCRSVSGQNKCCKTCHDLQQVIDYSFWSSWLCTVKLVWIVLLKFVHCWVTVVCHGLWHSNAPWIRYGLSMFVGVSHPSQFQGLQDALWKTAPDERDANHLPSSFKLISHQWLMRNGTYMADNDG